jgi:hypothetical protein
MLIITPHAQLSQDFGREFQKPLLQTPHLLDLRLTDAHIFPWVTSKSGSNHLLSCHCSVPTLDLALDLHHNPSI